MTFSYCRSTKQHNCACSFALNLVTMGIKQYPHSLPASAAFLCSLTLLEVTRYLNLLHNENAHLGCSAVHPKLNQHGIRGVPWKKLHMKTHWLMYKVQRVLPIALGGFYCARRLETVYIDLLLTWRSL